MEFDTLPKESEKTVRDTLPKESEKQKDSRRQSIPRVCYSLYIAKMESACKMYRSAPSVFHHQRGRVPPFPSLPSPLIPFLVIQWASVQSFPWDISGLYHSRQSSLNIFVALRVSVGSLVVSQTVKSVRSNTSYWQSNAIGLGRLCHFWCVSLPEWPGSFRWRCGSFTWQPLYKVRFSSPFECLQTALIRVSAASGSLSP